MNSRSANNRGFTLIEVVIAIALMAFISIGVFQALNSTYRTRDTLQSEGDFYSAIRVAMSILESDIAQIFSPEQMIPKKNAGLPAGTGQQPNEGDVPTEDRWWTYWGPMSHKNGIRLSRFFGTANSLFFVSASHLRVYRNSPESELARISYEIKKDDKVPDDEPWAKGTSVLIKTSNTNVFDFENDEDTFTRTYPLLTGLKSLVFRYYQREKNHWYDTWDSSHPDFKNLFPDLVEVRFEAVGPNNLLYDGIYQFRPELPVKGLPSTL